MARRKQIAAMDPETEYVQIVRLMLDYEFPWDLYRALELALFRTFAVPSIGRLLHRTGEFEKHPQQRYDDSVLMIHAMLYNGLQDDTGRAAVQHLNHIHGHYRISNADFLYTLATFAVVPARWIQEFGWRKLHKNEIRALTLDVIAMGNAMGIEGIPATYEGLAAFLDEYEAEHYAFDAGGSAVAETMIDLVASWNPIGTRHKARLAMLGLIDPPLAEALGLPVLPAQVRAATRSALKARGALVRLAPPRPDAKPFVLRTRTYPQGFSISKLGPAAFTK